MHYRECHFIKIPYNQINYNKTILISLLSVTYQTACRIRVSQPLRFPSPAPLGPAGVHTVCRGANWDVLTLQILE